MSVKGTLKTKWFWYSVLCIVCWGGWTIFGKLASNEIPASTMQFLFPFGCLPVVVPLLVSRRFRLERNAKGISYGIGNGVLAGIGGFALFAAYRTGRNTAVITTLLQVLGLAFAVAAFAIFSM